MAVVRPEEERFAGPDGRVWQPVAIHMEPTIARCRLLLSVIALIAVYVDPTEPTLMPWLNLSSGRFTIDPHVLGVMGGHLLYSAIIYYVLVRGLIPPPRLANITTWADVAFGAAIVVFTEGTSSPFWAYFVFAVIASGAHGGFRRSLAVTVVSVTIYLSLILFAWSGEANVFIVRPVYLAVVGYLTAYLGRERLGLQDEVHRLESARERNRIARALHDGCVQTVGAVTLTLEGVKELMRTGRAAEAETRLTELQASMDREYDELRSYVRRLAEVEPSERAAEPTRDTRVEVQAEFGGSAVMVENVLNIVREAVANVRRHAGAQKAAVSVRVADGQVLIAVDDDGVGFPDPERLPWSMSSRVNEAGGLIEVARDQRPGAHIRLALPEA
jgi:signal transduction histidine kinase